jgi:UDP-glucose 4-epimerase
MLEIARTHNSKFIYVSTSHVYGKPEKLPIKENHPLSPSSIYASSKVCAEFIVKSYAKNYDMDISILRLFSVYGINSPPNLVTSKIISQLLTKNKISIGNVTPKRDFIYIDDVIDAIELVLRKSRGFNIYNVGTGNSHSILEICNILKKISGKNHPLKSLKSNSRKNDVPNVISNITNLKQLGWIPKTSLSDGLQLTWNHYFNIKNL